ncbi:MAG: hypothetical protein ABIJ09_02695 [Pseudomonadota bacterium]
MRSTLMVIGLLVAGLVASLGSITQAVCEPGERDDCTCPDGVTGSEVCNDDGTEWGDCQCGNAGDPDGGHHDDSGVVLQDGGPVPDGAIGAPCPPTGCHPDLTALALADGGCECRRPCEPSQPVPRCVGWELCVQLRQLLDDGGSQFIDAGVCLPAAAPDEGCSPAPCSENLVCARIAQRDAGNTCRYSCNPTGDASVRDALGADAIPVPGSCPPAQTCYEMAVNVGACFVP